MIELRNVTKIYRLGKVELPALRKVSLQVADGEFIAIMGPSGSGKSTLLNIIGCLDLPTEGEYFLDGREVSKLSDSQLAMIRNEKIGFIFQNYNLLPRITALGNVELPLIYSGNYTRRKEKAKIALQAVNLSDRANHRPTELSGGEQQRVAIARALINEPKIILADEPTGNLDSRAGAEIMAILRQLNKKGITIIMVTHDNNVASYAQRIVRLRDGEIIEDFASAERMAPEVKTQQSTSWGKKRRFSLAELREGVRMAISSILANKLRSFLTMLGIIVGVAAVITMIAIGQGASAQITQRIRQMGSNLVMVNQFRRMVGGGSFTPLSYEDARSIAERIPLIARVDASFRRMASVIYGNQNITTEINGVTPNFPVIRNFPVERGTFFTEEDNRMMRRVAVLGKTVVRKLFGEEDPIGQYIKIKRNIFQVIGVMSEKGSSGFRDEDDVIFVPLRTAQKRIFGLDRDQVTEINIEVKEEKMLDSAVKEITKLLRERHRIQEGQEDDFNIRSQAEILSTVQETSRTFTMLLAGIAIVSLIVGGIGIMNIMFVSVTERTREIGIRKAIGARMIDILTQFLIEAIIISLCGGIIGILLGIGASKLTSQFAGWQTIVTPTSILLSFFFAFLVGFFFGVYPARKASLLNPIEALRYE
uniref:ATP-binding cassette domain-containing protein n=1 Tax=candidate division WOR-3 bacterium TaxID=2052148 RepID=A0A7C3Z351_UNCW3